MVRYSLLLPPSVFLMKLRERSKGYKTLIMQWDAVPVLDAGDYMLSNTLWRMCNMILILLFVIFPSSH